MKRNNPLSRRDEIVVQELDGEILIYDLRSNRALSLNETSALIWRACDGTRDIKQLGGVISDRLNVPVNEDLVWLALDQLKKEKLLAVGPDPTRFAGSSRREMIKKAAAGAMVALPVIVGLSAPSAAHAQSACGVCVCDNMTYAVGDACGTGMGGTACVAVGMNCDMCHAAVAGIPNPPGTCSNT